MREGHSAAGPGAITPDGCAVELYERLPVGEEPDIIERAVPKGARTLELGCGVGRVTHPIVERGFTVTAVDESPEMLKRIRGARTVRSPIETLELDERFDVVMLASFLVHTSDLRVRKGFLRTCRRHVTDDGCVLIQREGEGWHDNVPREGTYPGGGTVRVASSEPVAAGVRSVHVEYIFPDARWTQTFRSRPLTKQAFEELLAASGLTVDAYLTDDGTWVRALPVNGR
ncbi:class I SAM-dependent methyltransferase [Streptomyces sp. RB6PN25]|uniref:Class I SAM-dependent methyltransferase n=1 Tax=Streptomyces humicola TaxID=2953240 RepID=A0ABT1PZ17_9ACTN|nr:class I SAM-dependent methyltransferase [Streptomyces humicola]MCQ4082902.1 class I SAM-dependent methyltransferase [Streptomyces humicola]